VRDKTKTEMDIIIFIHLLDGRLYIIMKVNLTNYDKNNDKNQHRKSNEL